MDHMGAPFSRTQENKIAQRNFGGQSYPRTCYSADKTGHVILHTTYEQCLKEGVHFLQEWYLLDLVKSADGHVGGAVVWNMKEGRVEQIKAKAINLVHWWCRSYFLDSYYKPIPFHRRWYGSSFPRW